MKENIGILIEAENKETVDEFGKVIIGVLSICADRKTKRKALELLGKRFSKNISNCVVTMQGGEE